MRDDDDDDDFAPTSLDASPGRFALGEIEPPALRQAVSAAPVPASPTSSPAPPSAPAPPQEASVPKTAVLPLMKSEAPSVPQAAVLPGANQEEPDEDDVAMTELDRGVFDPLEPPRQQGAPRVGAPPARALPVAPSADGSDLGLKVALYVLVALIVLIAVALVVGIVFSI